jgi:predicted acylesterase/phospholipase RssA
MANDRTLDIVFEGGGARGLALNGGIAALESAGYGFGRLVGTSAGAISATLAAVGYTGAELRTLSLEKTASGASRMTEFVGTPRDFTDQDIFQSHLYRLLQAVDVPFVPDRVEQRADLWLMRQLLRVDGFAHLLSFTEKGGYFSADGFLAWLREKLEAKGPGTSGLTFAELHQRTGKHLSLIVTDTTSTRFLVLNHITAPRCPVLWGVRMSMSIPFFWPEVIWQPEWGAYRGEAYVDGNVIVDGGVVSNFGLRFLVSDEAWVEAIMGGAPDPESRVLGLWLDPSGVVAGAPPTRDPVSRVAAEVNGLHSPTLERIERVFGAAISGNDVVELRNHEELVCKLPTRGYGVTEFNMSQERIEALLAAGDIAVQTWLATRVPAKVSDVQATLKSPATQKSTATNPQPLGSSILSP